MIVGIVFTLGALGHLLPNHGECAKKPSTMIGHMDELFSTKKPHRGYISINVTPGFTLSPAKGTGKN
jgi:hypothetical protein